MIDWARFQRRPIDVVVPPGMVCFACGDGDQAVLWLLRTGLAADGRADAGVGGPVEVNVPGMEGVATLWDTVDGAPRGTAEAVGGRVSLPGVGADIAVAIRR